jgi:hypothetical protein
MDESQRSKPEHPEGGSPGPTPPLLFKFGGTELQKRAAQIGKAAGTVVAVFRDARRRLREPNQEPGHDRLNALGAIARTRAWELRRKAAEGAEHWRSAAQEMGAWLGGQAKTGYGNARDRARQTGRDYPVHVVIAAGLAGFLMGVGVRMRRSHRAG